MNPTARAPKPIRCLLLPAHWLERARGRRRLALAFLYLLILAVAGFFAWRATTLNGLPDVGDPFDIGAFGPTDLPPDEDAFTYYRRAVRAFRPLEAKGDAARYLTTDWARAAPEARAWVEGNREALDLWLRGADCERGCYLRPDRIGEPGADDGWPLDRLRSFHAIGPLEASRLALQGDLAGAWRLHRALLRSSRHVAMWGNSTLRNLGLSLLAREVPRAGAWAQDPRVDAPLLRRALGDALACEAMTRPTSEMLRAEYLTVSRNIDEPTDWMRMGFTDGSIWYHNLVDGPSVDRFLLREPERSRRVARLIFANWLAGCDNPRVATVPMPSGQRYYRDCGPDAPASARMLDPGTLDRWYASSILLRRNLEPLDELLRAIPLERRCLANLKVILAEQRYAREHGELPKSPDELVGRYLDALPEGFQGAGEDR